MSSPKTKKQAVINNLEVRFCQILGVENPNNPMVKQLVKNALEGQVIMIDTKHHTIVGLPSGEQ